MRDCLFNEAKYTGFSKSYVDVIYTKNDLVTDVVTVCSDNKRLEEIVLSVKPGATMMKTYLREVRLIDDIEISGPKRSFGRTIYFGKRLSGYDLLLMAKDKNCIPIDKEIVFCDNGEIVYDPDSFFTTFEEFLNDLHKSSESVKRLKK